MNGKLYINGNWSTGESPIFNSINPCDNKVLWKGNAASQSNIDNAIESAKVAFKQWSKLTLEKRVTFLRSYQEQLKLEQKDLAETISRETGKPLWESKTEVNAMIGKIDCSINAYTERCSEKKSETAIGKSITRFKPHGVIAVLGPFNLPGHLPNGHIIPALLAGNTIIFKPSEQTPLIAEMMISLWEQVNLPKGVISLIQGGSETAIILSKHENINGIFFTGSYETGCLIHKQLAGQPEKLLVLEMGGNNPLVIHEIDDIEKTVFTTIQSAFITSGQRCVCARRLIIVKSDKSDEYIKRLTEITSQLNIGKWNTEPEPFMGPMINSLAAENVYKDYLSLINYGGEVLLKMTKQGALLTPGIVKIKAGTILPDKESFGPLLKVHICESLDSAIDIANDTKFGLAAGIITNNRTAYEQFLSQLTAGIINWNRQITGAVSSAPFGGTGSSGNHRPSASLAADYCTYPVASIEIENLENTNTSFPGYPKTN